jgi:TatD DNase family protein
VFRTNVEASKATGLPLIVHAREADTEIAEILSAERPPPGVLHCFTGSRALAERAVSLGFYVSISGIVTFRNAEALRDIVRDLPLDRLLVETDAPYLAPVPYRGKRNEPAFVAATAAFVAELKGIELEALAEATTQNFFRLFAKARLPAS